MTTNEMTKERLRNKLFAFETNFHSLKRRLNGIPHSDDTDDIIKEMEHSIEQFKEILSGD